MLRRVLNMPTLLSLSPACNVRLVTNVFLLYVFWHSELLPNPLGNPQRSCITASPRICADLQHCIPLLYPEAPSWQVPNTGGSPGALMQSGTLRHRHSKLTVVSTQLPSPGTSESSHQTKKLVRAILPFSVESRLVPCLQATSPSGTSLFNSKLNIVFIVNDTPTPIPRIDMSFAFCVQSQLSPFEKQKLLPSVNQLYPLAHQDHDPSRTLGNHSTVNPTRSQRHGPSGPAHRRHETMRLSDLFIFLLGASASQRSENHTTTHYRFYPDLRHSPRY